jgi:hypothetical protein
MKDRIELEGGVSKDCMDNADTGVLLTKAGDGLQIRMRRCSENEVFEGRG